MKQTKKQEPKNAHKVKVKDINGKITYFYLPNKVGDYNENI